MHYCTALRRPRSCCHGRRRVAMPATRLYGAKHISVENAALSPCMISSGPVDVGRNWTKCQPFTLAAWNTVADISFVRLLLFPSIFSGNSAATTSGVASYGTLGHVPPRLVTVSFLVHFRVTEESQLSKYCVVCEISWCRCQQLAALSISIL